MGIERKRPGYGRLADRLAARAGFFGIRLPTAGGVETADRVGGAPLPCQVLTRSGLDVAGFHFCTVPNAHPKPLLIDCHIFSALARIRIWHVDFDGLACSQGVHQIARLGLQCFDLPPQLSGVLASAAGFLAGFVAFTLGLCHTLGPTVCFLGGGLGYWINSADKGMSTVSMGEAFVNSQEFHDLYHVTSTDKYLSGENVNDVVTGFYNHVLHRTPDAEGLNYYAGKISSHERTAGDVLAEISNSPENYVATIGQIDHGIQYDLWVE